MPDLLLELFSEEIPARMQVNAARDLQRLFEEAMIKANLTYRPIRTCVTPRRLTLMSYNIPFSQEDILIEKKGPKTNAQQAAIDGFLKSTGLALEKLEKRIVGKDETYFAITEQKGQPTRVILKDIIEKILVDFPWPKSMRWGSKPTRWVRPLHSILCLFDYEIIPIKFGNIKASNTTYGHRFLAPQAIAISQAEKYAAQSNSEEYIIRLKEAKVLTDHDERKQEILTQAETLAAKHNLTLKQDEGLLTEITGLVEWPTVLMGTIDASFMDLPPEVLTSEMRAHQKYLALLDASNNLASKFLLVSNMVTEDGGKAVVSGNERVLRARLADGRFFFDQDRKKSLDEWAEALKGVTFHAKIGSLAEKTDRIKILALALTDFVVGADKKLTERAAELCKADLVTGMVGEFPELQGVMGRYYALHQKEDAAVADAIRDHYLPMGPDSPVPSKPISICIALADKLDTLISMFAVGEKPTGSKDPFALRRSALGIIRIILENNIRLPLKKFLNAELLAFFSDRLKIMLREQNLRHDLIAAVIASGDDNLVCIVARTKALQDFLGTEDGTNLLAAYRRAINILAIEERNDKQAYKGDVQLTTLQAEEEKNLFSMLEKITPHVTKALENEEFAEAMRIFAALRIPVDTFFDRVLVNVEDKKLRSNRLHVLARIRVTMDTIANFALIEG
jgi:glycyl-tRNA synthetase beta chain